VGTFRRTSEKKKKYLGGMRDLRNSREENSRGKDSVAMVEIRARVDIKEEDLDNFRY